MIYGKYREKKTTTYNRCGQVHIFRSFNRHIRGCNIWYIEKLGHDITNADIPPEVDSMWRGLTQKDGVVEVGNDTKTVYFGVAWRIMKSDGSYRYVRYYKGSYSFASNVGGKTKASSGAPEKQTAKATYTAVQRDFDNNYYAYFDESDLPSNITRDEFENKWFTDMNYYPQTV